MNTRRHLLKSGLYALGTSAVAPAFLRGQALNEKLQVAFIGVTRMGLTNLNAIANHPQVVVSCLCDVDQKRLAKTAKNHPEAKKFQDWRVMFAEAADQFDAVVVCTPDHQHAPMMLTALSQGKHLYGQKPLCFTLEETRMVTELAKKKGLVTQMGIQRMSSLVNRMAVDLLQRGALGKLQEVHCWHNNMPTWHLNERDVSLEHPIPKNLDWDLWLGPAKERAYIDEYYHPRMWRGWTDLGLGQMGDFGCHYIQVPFSGLGLKAPIKVRSVGNKAPEDYFLLGARVEYEFPESDLVAKGFRMIWMDGGQKPDLATEDMPAGFTKVPENGIYFRGEEGGMMQPFESAPRMLDLVKQKSFGMKVSSGNHYHEWVDAVLANQKCSADFDFGGPLTEAVLVGVGAQHKPDQWLDWNATELQYTGQEELNANFVSREYREGWKLKNFIS